METSDAAAAEDVAVACACLNVRFTAKRAAEGDSAFRDLGNWAISQPGLVRILEAGTQQGSGSNAGNTRRRASQSPTDRQSVSKGASSSASSYSLRRLHCYGCESDVLTFETTENDDNSSNSNQQLSHVQSDKPPQSRNGVYTVDPASSAIIGNEAINAIVEKPSESGYSSLFGMVVHVSDKVKRQREASSSSTAEATEGEDGEDMPEQSTLKRQAKSSDLQRTLSDEINDATTQYHEDAKQRIRQEKQEMDSQIAKLRSEREERARAYLAQADMLSTKAASLFTVKPRGRRSSPSKPSTSSTARKGKPSPSPPIVIRGGFEDPSSPVSPPPSAVGASPRTNLASMSPPVKPKSYKAFLSMISGEPLEEASEPPKDVAKASQPQSPSMRRSRSPSPTRDLAASSSRATERQNSRDRSTPKASTSKSVDFAQSPSMARGDSASGSVSKRPPLNLENDVKAGAASFPSVPRPSLTPQHSSLKNPSSVTPKAKSIGGAWLKLNGEVSSPPSSKRMSGSLLQNMEDAVNRIEKAREEEKLAQRKAENDVSSIFEKNKEQTEERPSLQKARHVSFKEPEMPASKPAPLPDNDDDAVFELDEEVEASSDEEDTLEETIASSVPTGSDITAVSKSRSLSPNPPLPPGASSYREQHASLIELLDNARSFVGSLKTVYQPKPPPDLATSVKEAYSAYGSKRYHGSTRLTGQGIDLPRHASLPQSAVSPEVAASLREQSQKFRDMLAMDMPSHRGRGSRNKKSTAALLRESEELADDEITNEEMERLAPLSNLATSLPIAIGFPIGPTRRRPDIEFEQKTSVPTGESMMVPRYKRDKRADGTYMHSVGGLPILGEEAEPTPASSVNGTPTERCEAIPGAEQERRIKLEDLQAPELSQGSPPNVPKLDTTTAAQDASIALTSREEGDEQDLHDEMTDIKDKGGFVPPHLWSRRKIAAADMLGTSVHDYE